MSKITVFIVDKQSLYRVGVHRVLSVKENIQVIGDCDFTVNAREYIEAIYPDVVLIDIDLPAMTGIELALQISRRIPRVRVIVLSSFPDDDQLFRVMKAGAAAYLSKNVPADELIDIVERVGRGEYPINDSILSHPTVAEKVLTQFQNISLMGNIMETVGSPITSREKEILSYVANGQSNKQIASTLDISEQTIKNHVSSILRKLNANDRTQAVVMAMRHGWISLDAPGENNQLAREQNMVDGIAQQDKMVDGFH